MSETVSTEAFWELMCCPHFQRVDMYTGRLRGVEYRVTIPPEDVPGFIQGRIEETIGLLRR